MSIWIETKDGRIIDARANFESIVCGREVIFNEDAPIRYGENIPIEKKEIVEDDLLLLGMPDGNS